MIALNFYSADDRDMTETLMKFILKIRTAIYVVGVVAILLSLYLHRANANETENSHQECFFPPDLVPHPHIPDPEQSDGWA
jgi:hypothetical protein